MALLMMVTVTYFAHKNGWGGDIKFSGSALRQGADRTRRRDRLAAGGWALVQAGPACTQQTVMLRR